MLSVVLKYGKAESDIKTKENCAVGAGYTLCKDFNFQAVDLFKQLDKDGKLEGINVTP